MLREPFKVRRRAKRALAAASAVVAAAGWGATVVEDEFTLTCADAAVEGTTLGCELRNGGEAAAPWPVVGVLHLSSDGAGEARLRGAPVDLRLLPPGHGAATDGGVWWTGDTLVGYERFDWDGDAEPGESRSFAAVSVEDDTDYEGEEWFYVAMAASGRRGIGFLYDSRQPVGIPANDIPSDDAGLNALSVSTWAEHVALAFSPDVLAYSVAVGYGVTEVLVSARASDARATVTVAGETPVRDGGVPVPLGVGPTTVEVRVTAEDGSAPPGTYSVTLTRAERTPEVTVVQGGFELVCPASASEGEQLACMLRNNGDVGCRVPGGRGDAQFRGRGPGPGGARLERRGVRPGRSARRGAVAAARALPARLRGPVRRAGHATPDGVRVREVRLDGRGGTGRGQERGGVGAGGRARRGAGGLLRGACAGWIHRALGVRAQLAAGGDRGAERGARVLRPGGFRGAGESDGGGNGDGSGPGRRGRSPIRPQRRGGCGAVRDRRGERRAGVPRGAGLRVAGRRRGGQRIRRRRDGDRRNRRPRAERGAGGGRARHGRCRAGAAAGGDRGSGPRRRSPRARRRCSRRPSGRRCRGR